MKGVVEVTVVKSTFAKELNYFLSLQLDEGEKLRTEVAERSRKPEFKNNVFRMQGPVLRQVNMREVPLKICGFVILEDQEGKPSLLGSGSLDVGSLAKLLEGGRAVLCDDILLTRKSRKKGQEDQDITVGKVQIQLRYSEGAGEWQGGKEVHPDTSICKVTFHQAFLDKQLDPNGQVYVEGRLITQEAHQSLLAYRENKEENLAAFSKYWPSLLFQSNAGEVSQDEFENVFHFNKVTGFRIDPRAWEVNRGIRLDVVTRRMEDPYDTKKKEKASSSARDLSTWNSMGGVTLGLGHFHKLQQYNLKFMFSRNASLDVSVEIQPSFNEDFQYYSQHQDSQVLRRVQVQVCGIKSKLPHDVEFPYVRVSGMDGGSTSNREKQQLVQFHECKPLMNPLISGETNLRESTCNLRDEYALDQHAKITPRYNGASTQPSWEDFPILDFNAEDEDQFSRTVKLEFFHKNGIKFGQSVIKLKKDTPLDGSLIHLKKVPIQLDPKFHSDTEDEEVLVLDDEEKGEKELDLNKLKKKAQPSVEVKMHIWSAAAYLTFLNESILEQPTSPTSMEDDHQDGQNNNRNSPAVPKLPLTNNNNLVVSPKSQEELDFLSYRRSVDLDNPPSPELTPAPSREETPIDEPPLGTKTKSETPDSEALMSPSRAASRQEHKHTEEAKAALEERIGILTADLNNKQALIDRLIGEVDKRNDAIRSCGAEIVQLRKSNEALEQERNAAVTKLQQMEQDMYKEAHTLASTENVEAIDPSNVQEMKRRISLLGKKYENERARNQEIVQRLEILQQVASKNRQLMEDYNKMEKAHSAQARYIQELQEENAQIGLYKATIKTQEKVIVKLEDLLETKLQDGGMTRSNQYIEEIERLRSRNAELENSLLNGDFIGDNTLQERIKELEAQLAEKNAEGPASSARPETSTDEKDERIKALEEQLVDNAKKFAKEISEARMKIFEFEAMQSVNEI